MDEDPLITENIASCLMCNTTFETHEECFVHTCPQIKTESNELDIEKQTNSFHQEYFKLDMNPDFLERNLIYGLKRKKQKKSNMIESKDVSGEDSDYSSIEKKQVKRNTIKKQIKKRIMCEITDQKQNCGKQKNKKPRVEEEEWLTAYKSQCKLGEHNNIEMAKLIGMNVDTFRGKIARERKKTEVIEIAYNGPLKCQFCLKIQSQEAEDSESDPFVRPKRKNLITEEMLAKVATRCSKHTHLNMANFFGVKRNALTKRINMANLVFSNTEEDQLICFFCQKMPSINSPTIKNKQGKRNTTKKQMQKRLSCEKTDQTKNFGKQNSFQPIVEPKKETNELEYEYEDQFDFCDNYDLELTEEFISLILKQVDDLCENIQNGDPNMDRTLEVNQNLNNAVHCYRTHYAKNRNKNSVDNYYVIKDEVQEYYDHTEVNLDSDYKEIQYDNKNEEKSRLAQKRKGGPARKVCVDKKYELVKNQCGKHSVKSMGLMLHMHNNTLKNRIKVDGIVFKENEIDDCYFCEMMKNNENISKDLLYNFTIYDNDKDNFKCSVCQFSKKNRCDIFTHIRSIHKNEINASTNSKIVEKNDCGNTSCKKLYGILDNQKYWCRKCIELSQMPKPDFFQPACKTVKNKLKLCPECGKVSLY